MYILKTMSSIYVFAALLLMVCQSDVQPADSVVSYNVGAVQMEQYLPLLQGKRVALVVNASSMVGQVHLVDTLLAQGVQMVRLFAPEHGFRSDADAGATIVHGIDSRTGLPIASLYGKTKKPTPEQLQDVDVVVFDIQDAGVRFYTYISTLHYVMEACAQQGKPLVVLDRGNPNAHRVDGPVLEPAFVSFVGMHPVPVLYGMTVGEYARMINGQGWLAGGVQAGLTVVQAVGYRRRQYPDELPVRPSPNLPNLRSMLLYPSLCFFEGTHVSVGRGTEFQFQLIGAPGCVGDTTFIPRPNFGAASPLHNGLLCHGYSWAGLDARVLFASDTLMLEPLQKMWAGCSQNKFFSSPDFFDKLAGNAQLRQQISKKVPAETIRASWQPALERFKQIRAQYLLYPE